MQNGEQQRSRFGRPFQTEQLRTCIQFESEILPRSSFEKAGNGAAALHEHLIQIVQGTCKRTDPSFSLETLNTLLTAVIKNDGIRSGRAAEEQNDEERAKHDTSTQQIFEQSAQIDAKL